MLLAACVVLSVVLCVWGAVGWRRAYRAQAEADRLTRAEQLRDAQLLRIVVSGGEAIAQMALEGISDNVDVPRGLRRGGVCSGANRDSGGLLLRGGRMKSPHVEAKAARQCRGVGWVHRMCPYG